MVGEESAVSRKKALVTSPRVAWYVMIGAGTLGMVLSLGLALWVEAIIGTTEPAFWALYGIGFGGSAFLAAAGAWRLRHTK